MQLENQPGWADRVFKFQITHPDIDDMLAWGQWFVRHAFNNARDKGTWLVIRGYTGSGKTRLAKKCYRYLRDYRIDMWSRPGWGGSMAGALPKIEFVDWARLVADDEEEFDYQCQDYTAADILFLDDLGAENDKFKNGTSAARLRRILEPLTARWVFVTTNIIRSQWAEFYDDRVASRLSAANYFDGGNIPDFRPNLRSSLE